MVDVGGDQICLLEACERYGLPYHTVRGRVHKLKWSAEKALATPIRDAAKAADAAKEARK